MINLRPYQQECVDKINALSGGAHLVQMATGLGKTVTFASIERKGRRAIVVVLGSASAQLRDQHARNLMEDALSSL